MEYQILLCCITPFENHDLIDESSIRKVFEKYVGVKNIKIFRREKQIKAFVEIDGTAIETCFKKIHLKKCDIGKITLYVSNKTHVVFGNKKRNKDSYSNNILNHNPPDNINKATYIKNKKMNTPDHIIKDNDKNMNMNTQIDSTNIKLQNIDKNYDKDLVDKKNNLFYLRNKCQNYLYKDHNNESNNGSNNVSNVLIVECINIKKVNCLMLMNIFGCFGNVTKILLNTKLKCAFIELEDSEYISICIRCLDNIRFFGNNIKVKYYCHNLVSLDNLEKDEDSDFQYLRGHYKYFRFKKGINEEITKPSSILYITSLASKFTPQMLCGIISKLHEPNKMVRIKKENIKHDLYIISFDKIFQAIEVLSMFYNKKVNEKLLKISFANIDINQFN